MQKYKKVTIEDKEIDDKLIAKQLLYKWIQQNKPFEKKLKRYQRFEFRCGDGGELNFKKIKEHIYYVIIEQTDSISKNHSITVHYHITINTLKNKVKLKKTHIVSNTLPISKLVKSLEKIFN